MRGNSSDNFWRYDTFLDTWESLSKPNFGVPDSAVTNNVYIGGELAYDAENELIYAIQGNYYHGFSVYDINRDAWTLLGPLPILPYYGASIEYYPADNSIYYTPGDNKVNLYKYDISAGEWEELTPAPIGFYYGGGLHVFGQCMYAIRGSASNLFYKYNIEKNSWLIPTRGLYSRVYEGSVLLTQNNGADIVKGDGDHFYITRGNYGDEFIRWNQTTGEVRRMPNTPTGVFVGSSMVYDNTRNKIYLTAGGVENGFFIFDINENIWSEDATDKVPVVVNSGSSMVYDGSRYIYLTRGASTNTFYRYDILGSTGAKWTTIANVSATLGAGSELLINNGSIYTLRGLNVTPNPFYSYNIGTNTWSSLTSLSSQVNTDGFLTDGGNGNFYAARGSNTSEFYKYSISGNSWSALPSFPGQISTGGSGESNGVNKIYVLPGVGTNTYSDGLYTYVYETDNSSFVTEGTYESQVHDFTSVYQWASLSVSRTVAQNTSIQIETSSSEDGVVWGEWAAVSREKTLGTVVNYQINSPAERYFKVRFTLSSGDGILSSVLSSYTVNYFQDTARPSNPSIEGFTALESDGSSNEINSNTWYNFASPKFSWADAEEEFGASDGQNGSGIAGYYVYWGTTAGASPEELGIIQESAMYAPSSLIDGSTYYLRIQAVDRAGNVSQDVWQPFIYKYDSSAPAIVGNLSADPAGYTATDSFNFHWDASVSNGAPVDEYCYKTGASTGPYATDQCTTATTVEDIPSHKVGTNTFSVRVRDEAGNLSNYATVSYFYVDSENAPAPPTNLQVSPVSSTANSFGFSWDPPLPGTYYGSQSNLSYLYSVNALPTEYSVSATSLRYLNPGAYATLPGENKFYIVTKDEAGNVNYNDYAEVSFFANTVAPGIPLNLEIADVSVKSTSSWRLAVSWDPPEDEGSGVAGYQIFRSVDGETFYFHSYTSGSSLVDSRLIQTTYYYKVKACDSTNNCGAFSGVVNLYPDGRYIEPAQLIVEPEISNISPKKATVSWVTARTADSRVAYGVESGVYFDAEVSNSDQVVDHILTINNLTPGTKYYYVVRWTDEDGNTGESEEDFFITAPPPTIQEPVVKRVGLESALIEFMTKDTVKVRVYYGETSAFGGITEVFTGMSEGTHYVELTNLKHGTKYFYKINTVDVDNVEYEGEIHSFETLPRPQVLDTKILQVKGTSFTTLLVEWNANTPISSVVTYYPTAAPERALDEVNVALKGGLHRMVLLNLDPNTPYSIIISGRDFMGNEASSGVIPFTTASDTRPPQIFDLEVTSEILGSGQEATAQLVVSYKTDEKATSQIEYGEGTGTTYSQKTQEDSTLSENHIVIISGLTPSKVYHLRAASKDAANNIGYSIDKVVVTNPSTEDAYNLVIKNLLSIFSFLDNTR